VDKDLCQFPAIILHISELPADHPAQVTPWIQWEAAEMFAKP
jgi:hypothetical protein